MAIETYKDCEIEFGGYEFEWGHKDYDGPNPWSDIQLCGHAKTIKECYEQIDEMYADMEAESDAQDFIEEMQAGQFDIKRAIKEHG